MRLVLISLLLAITTLSAEYIRQPIDQKLVNSKIKIIDIRTPNEWKTTGIVKGSYPIMFFDEQGNYNVEMFLDKLNKVVKKEEKFALICNSGNRTQTVGTFLGKQLGYNVIDLQGGIQYAIGKKITLEPYKPKP
ncbi:rhodanese-like domain-containing protein [Sulfuricurvum sp. RIFCSPLOWO2_12_FULL_43_24]|uniref:rhodanese-like domain-containing protein n=1 Tax=Sulfuricurvum sp. RIFCSPLOWO2_12_FULL_43_24 TaxID=1802247 RepID=UPI0008C9B1B7|nr:rhodanese-like domain-containing protein [Sulfuricurvum sp. RIFCSPLOWO2_12_FULL_43_24]OHD86251.1 MAG: sulfurtransferase [Sulfuricurvum sp. RIFCSPLOWO2_02_FULL_43_45]OHD87470.1 MAG: sulfurtransferase [Sulfuricurvum sp. RIFCSPLOWO2_02_43_6]OHD88041.1 MAG: sulfurtransferase [Sulfuricurvum sp. RIFCSPLOWO2_12_43_5]OHD90438.1 MAG: sulfurtransferase [Sulfuricurvum sp. RIFCSPLOWO2_12_FULL_43_24]